MLKLRHCLLSAILGMTIVLSEAFPLFAMETASPPDDELLSLLVNTAQNQAINVLDSDSVNNLLFSASEGGSINVYAEGRDLVQHLQISTDPIVNLALNNNGYMAIIEKKPDHRFRLSLWDWKNNHEVWNAIIGDIPLSLGFSPRGNYVVVTLARWNSLLFIETTNGRVQPWLSQGFGMIDYALVSNKEERILTYHASNGKLSYHALNSGAELKVLSTQRQLRQFQIVPDPARTHACAVDSNKLYSIDLLNGKILDSKTIGFAPTQLLCDQSEPTRIVVIGGPENASRINTFSIDLKTGKLSSQGTDKITLKAGLTAACLLQGKLYASDRSGLIVQVLPKDTRKNLAEHLLANIVGLGLSDGLLYLSTSAGLVRIQTDLLVNQPGQAITISRPKGKIISGIPANSGLIRLSDRELLLWDTGTKPKLYRYDLKQDSIIRTSIPAPNSFIRVKISDKQVMTVDAAGLVRIVDNQEFRPIFSHNALGALTVEHIEGGEILLGKASTGVLDSPLLRINEKTGETVAIASPDSAAFLSRLDVSTKSIFLLTTSLLEGKQLTSLKKLPIEHIDSPAQTIMNFLGEDLGAGLVLSPDGSTVYTSAGRAVVSAWNGQLVSTLEETSRVPRDLYVWGKLLFAINQDGSLSVWNAENRKFLMDIFVLTSGSSFFLTRSAAYGLISLNNSAGSTEENRTRALVESVLSIPANLRDKANFQIKPVQYPLQLP